MKKVIAALDNSLAAKPVLATAAAFAKLFDAGIEPVHVRTNGARVPRGIVEAAGAELRELEGPVVDRLASLATEPETAALVIGARGTPTRARPLGSTALAVATTVRKPVVVVPPDVQVRDVLRRVLVPVEAGSESFTPHEIVEVARDAAIDVVVLHVLDEARVPAFTDQPQHEHETWAREFIRRYAPWGIDTVRLEIRVGRVDQLVPLVAADAEADLIALGWAQRLAAGRARVIQATLEHASVPVLLVPVRVSSPAVAGAAAVGATAE